MFNLNIHNGLPSNHVYSVITDKHGYLWIATTKGVVRYNGYEFKQFTISDGLPTDDVWQLTEDSSGKIWLGCIADKMGYIYNEKYHNAVFLDTVYHTIYPTNMTAKGNSIVFFTTYLHNNDNSAYCVVKGDTVYNYSLFEAVRKSVKGFDSDPQKSFFIPFINEKNTGIFLYDYYLYTFSLNKNNIHINYLSKVDDSILCGNMGQQRNFLANGHIITYPLAVNNSKFTSIDIRTGKTTHIDLKDYGINEPLINIYHNPDHNDNNFYAFTKNQIVQYKVSNDVDYLGTTEICAISADSSVVGDKISILYTGDYWYKCLCTNTSGLYIKYNTTNKFTRHTNINLVNYLYKGTTEDGQSIWWNFSNQSVCLIDKSYKTKYLKADDRKDDIEFTNVNRNFFSLGPMSYFLEVKSQKIYQIMLKKYAINKWIISSSDRKWYFISNFSFSTLDPQKGRESEVVIDRDKYKDLIYDSFRNSFWVYNPNKIIIYNDRSKQVFTQQKLAQFGIKRAEKICLDNQFGNVFLKGYTKLVMYNYDKKNYTELFPEYNLKEASIYLYKNVLITYGRFGIIYSKVLGEQRLSNPIYYPNIKNAYYNYINDAQFSDDKILLNTDMGIYSVEIPQADSLFKPSDALAPTQYNFVCYYKNDVKNISTGDTIYMDQNDLRLRFDIINPTGNGEIKYSVKIQNGSTTELNSNEFNMPSLPSDNYYQISLSANDRVWRSKPAVLTIYIKPYWWQTQKMIRIIWVSTILLIVLLFGAAVLITRRLVLISNTKKNMRMELELKSIYAQINPHFIFNSLNSALLLVSKNQTEEAYIHISKFSRLLRSYIRSSRNKSISIDEEVKNLRNYIELQQIRFKEKFTYQIIIDSSIDQDRVMLPSLLLQPFVENAINHGLLQKEQNGNLKIEFKTGEDGNSLLCIIDDDGIGRTRSKQINNLNVTKDESYGDMLIKDLINIFNKYEKMNIAVTYTDKSEPLTGTIVTIKIKYKSHV